MWYIPLCSSFFLNSRTTYFWWCLEYFRNYILLSISLSFIFMMCFPVGQSVKLARPVFPLWLNSPICVINSWSLTRGECGCVVCLLSIILHQNVLNYLRQRVDSWTIHFKILCRFDLFLKLYIHNFEHIGISKIRLFSSLNSEVREKGVPLCRIIVEYLFSFL